MLPVIFHEFAQSELNEAAAYYAKARPGLGEAFIVEVEQAVAALAASPQAGAEVESGVRWWLVKQFPYSVLYRLHDDQIRVLAIAHQKRRPSTGEVANNGDAPNKPMVPTAPAAPATNPLHPMRRHIGQPLDDRAAAQTGNGPNGQLPEQTVCGDQRTASGERRAACKRQPLNRGPMLCGVREVKLARQ